MFKNIVICVLLLFSLLLSKNLIIHLSDGSIKHYPVSDIQKITFDVQSVNINGSSVPDQNGILTTVTLSPAALRVNIKYSVIRNSPVSIQIYSMQGKHIKTVTDEMRKPGTYSASWDCTDAGGARCGSGNYVVYMKIGKIIIAKSIINVI